MVGSEVGREPWRGDLDLFDIRVACGLSALLTTRSVGSDRPA
jgi:hypothetical protein